MTKHTIFAIALTLGGCAMSSSNHEIPSGSHAGTCSIDGVRRERGDPDEPMSYDGPATLTIEGGALQLGPGCSARLVGYDGTRFDVEPTTCLVLDGTTRYAPMEIRDGYGEIDATGLTIHLAIFWDRTVSGWTEEYTLDCVTP
jgi:hypothetical protein